MKQSIVNAIECWKAYDLPPMERDALDHRLLDMLYKRLEDEPEEASSPPAPKKRAKSKLKKKKTKH